MEKKKKNEAKRKIGKKNKRKSKRAITRRAGLLHQRIVKAAASLPQTPFSHRASRESNLQKQVSISRVNRRSLANNHRCFLPFFIRLLLPRRINRGTTLTALPKGIKGHHRGFYAKVRDPSDKMEPKQCGRDGGEWFSSGIVRVKAVKKMR